MNKSKKTSVTYFILIVYCFALAKILSAQTGTDFYPFHVGDYWVEHTDVFGGTYQPTTSRMDVESLDLINGKEYFRMKQRITADDGSDEMIWYSWMRVDSTGIIMGAYGESPEFVQIDIPTKTIIVDGNPDDWTGINPLVTDEQGDDSPIYNGDDIKALYIAKDADNLYLRMDLWENVNTSFGNGPSPNEGAYQISVYNDGPYDRMQLGVGYDQSLSQWDLGYNGSSSDYPTGLSGPDYVGVSGGIIEIFVPLSLIGTPSDYEGVEGEVNNCCVQDYGILDEAGLVSASIFDPPLLWMKLDETLDVGYTWESNVPAMGGNYIWTVESLSETVQVPAGTFNDCAKFKLIIIDTAGDTVQISNMYYAQGVGTVMNKGWGTWSDEFQFELIEYYVQSPKSMQVEPDTTAVAGRNLDITVTPTKNFQPNTRRLYYRNAGESNWQYIDLTATGDTLNFTIPSDSVSNRGLEYYVYLSDGVNEITYPEINPQNNPAKIQVAVDHQTAPLNFSSMNYKMVSVPLNLENSTICDVLCDDYNIYDIQHWRVLRWQTVGDSTGYFEYPFIQANFSPGNAFWLITRSGESFDVENGWSINSSQPVYYTLQPGWNQVANPFAFPVSDDTLGNTDLLEPPVFYDGNEYKYEQPILYPWEGYFVYNTSTVPVEISIPPVEANLALLPKTKSRFETVSEDGYLLQLSAKMSDTKLVDTQNYIGFSSLASDDKDKFDLFEAPPIGEYLQVSIMENKNRFASNFKSVTEQGHQWDIEISLSEFIKKPIEITLIETGKLPDDFKLFVLDRNYISSIPIKNKNFTIEINRKYPIRNIKLMIGTEEFAQQNNENIPLVPIEYKLKQNYPNPFNAETVIQYQLAKRTLVELTIYNILGRKVLTLINEIQMTGFHSIHWDGLNETKTAVASGVYFYRIEAGDFLEKKKLLLVR